MYICHNIIDLCLLMAKSMFSADFANKVFPCYTYAKLKLCNYDNGHMSQYNVFN